LVKMSILLLLFAAAAAAASVAVAGAANLCWHLESASLAYKYGLKSYLYLCRNPLGLHLLISAVDISNLID
ncbi:hypothetical protein STEG23_033748, partial [Scotinomys teguina]